MRINSETFKTNYNLQKKVDLNNVHCMFKRELILQMSVKLLIYLMFHNFSKQ